jgi:hypothetical protein
VNLVEHLAEMDRLLRDIQIELLSDREPAPPLAGIADTPPPSSGPPPFDEPSPRPATPEPQLRLLSELSAGLLASMRELLAGYERVLVGRAPPPARRPAPRHPHGPDAPLSAAPFPSLEALREFEAAVARLPGVREVAVQGHEGTDRATIEVRLGPS